MKEGLSVIIPVFNEEKVLERNVVRLKKFLEKYKQPFEIILGNNGSIDKTEEIGRNLEKKFKGKIKFVSTNEKGVGAGVKIAISAASYDKLIEMPADLSIELKFIKDCCELLNEYDVVVGSKKLGSQDRKFYMKLLSYSYIFLTNLLLGLIYSDYSVGGKGYRKSLIFDKVKNLSNGSFYVTELIHYAKKKVAKITELPMTCEDKRRSRFNMMKEVFYRLKTLSSFWFRENIL